MLRKTASTRFPSGCSLLLGERDGAPEATLTYIRFQPGTAAIIYRNLRESFE